MQDTVNGEFFRALLALHRDQFQIAQKAIDRTRELLDTELTALVGESYNRAYNKMVIVQQLSEMEEIFQYKQAKDNPPRREMIRKIWMERLKGTERNVEVHQSAML